MNLSPYALLKAAIRAVPQLKWALAVAGLVAVVAITSAFKIGPDVAAFGSVVILVLMVALLVFSKLATTAGKKHFLKPALVMMWSFLALTVAAAFLLFTSAFFEWPLSRDVWSRDPKVGNNRHGDRLHPDAKLLLQSAEARLEANDHAGAWATLKQAAAIQPHIEVVNRQADLAMLSLRRLVKSRDFNMGFHDKSLGPLVEEFTSALYAGLGHAKQQLRKDPGARLRAANISAHIGWAHDVSTRDTFERSEVQALYAQALEYDPTNVFAHAMRGVFLLSEEGKIKEAQRDFQAAFATHQEHAWVREMQIYGLRQEPGLEHNMELLRLAEQLRNSNEAISSSTRSQIFGQLYWRMWDEPKWKTLMSALPASEHLATFRWLLGDQKWQGLSAPQRVTLAYLLEQTGDWTGALEVYESMLGKGYSWEREMAAAAKRCQAEIQRR